MCLLTLKLSHTKIFCVKGQKYFYMLDLVFVFFKGKNMF